MFPCIFLIMSKCSFQGMICSEIRKLKKEVGMLGEGEGSCVKQEEECDDMWPSTFLYTEHERLHFIISGVALCNFR